jgi:hypothetical protein
MLPAAPSSLVLWNYTTLLQYDLPRHLDNDAGTKQEQATEYLQFGCIFQLKEKDCNAE